MTIVVTFEFNIINKIYDNKYNIKEELFLATYDLTSSIPSISSLKTGDILNCPYSGTYKSITLPAGTYKLECWGSRGGGQQDGNSNAGLGGMGGYSYGVLTLRTTTTLYCYSGGIGAIGYSALSKGGFNGGGSAWGSSDTEPGCGGGGASDIRIGSTSLYARVIVAGGGGGWYGGGGSYPDSSGDDDRGGGGGSGYVYTSSTASNYPSGCLLNSSYYLTDAQTIAGNTSFTSPSGGTETGHSGNGYIRITVNKLPSEITEIYIKTKTPIQSLLPSGYTALEYIESVGAQYIDTGLIVNKTDSYEMILIAHLINNDNWAGANGYLQFQAKIGNNKKSKIDIKYINKIETIFVDNQQVSSTDWSTSYNGTNVKLGIFKLGDANNTWYSQTGQSGKLYSCKILNNNNLIRNFIPCKNTSGIAGLWDTINKQFYVSASIADFTAGPVTTTATTSWVKIGSL